MKNTHEPPPFTELISSFEHTHTALQKQAVRSVDAALVVRNWLFGYYIVEFENGGAERAELYGKRLIEKLSLKLKKCLGKGFSQRSLNSSSVLFTIFKDSADSVCGILVAYFSTEQHQLISLKKGDLCNVDLVKHLFERFTISWSHYVALLRIT